MEEPNVTDSDSFSSTMMNTCRIGGSVAVVAAVSALRETGRSDGVLIALADAPAADTRIPNIAAPIAAVRRRRCRTFAPLVGLVAIIYPLGVTDAGERRSATTLL